MPKKQQQSDPQNSSSSQHTQSEHENSQLSQEAKSQLSNAAKIKKGNQEYKFTIFLFCRSPK